MTIAAAILVSPNVPAGAGTSYSLAASLSPTSLSQAGTTSTITTIGSSTTTATGGTPPYTYQWIGDDNPDGIQATLPTTATTAFRRPSTISGDVYIATFFCTVTDALGSKATTPVDVTITITRS